MLNVTRQIWYLLLLALTSAVILPPRPRFLDSLPSFEIASRNEFVVDDKTGDVFVGAKNALYHFSSNLTLKQKVSTGPVKDYSGCFKPPYPCTTARKDTNNFVEILKIVDFLGDTSYILWCGTVYNNLCQVRPIDNLEEYHWVEPYNETLGFTTNEILNFALFHRGLDGRTSLITATRDDNSKRNSKSAPFLSSKVLQKDGDRFYFEYTFQNALSSSKLVFNSASSRTTYDDGFVHGDFIYFPVVYIKVSTVLLVVKQVLRENKIVRFCANDTTLRSYAELPIICKYEGKVMTNLMAAHIGPSRKVPGTMDLYTSFTDDEKTGSALCVFPMREIDKAFKTYPRICNDDLVGKPCRSNQVSEISDFCGPEVRPYICTSTCMVPYFTFVHSVTVSYIKVVKQGDELVAIITSDKGELIKISMRTGLIISRKSIATKDAIRFTFDKQKENAYLLTYNKIIKYPVASCRVHETCQECFSPTKGKSDPLGCGWCSDGRCAHEEECEHPNSFSNNTCSPVLIGVFPKRSPIQGSNNLMIFGDNFGSYVDVQNPVLVAGVPCTPTFWSNTQVNCTLGSTPKELSGPVILYAASNYSSSDGYGIIGSCSTKNNFTYYAGPRLYGIRPSKGPTSGGTLVKLYGENLDQDQDKMRSVSVHGRPCHIKESGSNTITCITSDPSRRMDPKSTIALHINGILYLLDKHPPPEFNLSGLSQVFEFTPDPVITNIQPGYTTVSGLMNLTASGRYLDSVQFPKLVMKVDENQIVGKTEFIKDCWTDPQSNGTVMLCPTPNLKDRLVYPTRTRPLLAQVSFLMDGVQDLKDFSIHHRDLSRLLYYPDPEFAVAQAPFLVKKGQKILQIKGDNLDLIHAKEKLMVNIGKNESCDITKVSSDAIFCNLASSIFASNLSHDETNLAVEVLHGSTTHHLGHIEFFQPKEPQANTQEDAQEDSKEEGSNLSVILTVAVVIAICSCVALVGYKCYWRRGKKPFSINHANRTAVNHDYRPVPIRSFVHQNGQEQIPESSKQASLVHLVPVATNSEISVNVNSSRPRVSIYAAPPTVPITDVQEDVMDEISPFVDEETRFKFTERNLLISDRYLTVTDEKLGSGYFGSVNKGLLRRQNEIEQITVAVKVLHRSSQVNRKEDMEQFLEEAIIMLDLKHDNILRLFGVCLGRMPKIVLQFMCNGSLIKYIQDEDRENLIVSDLLKFAVDVAAGMEYLEASRSLHRDLAARNVLLDEKCNAVVSDFGLSRDIYEKEYYTWEQSSETKVPLKWTAPEALHERKFTTKSDVWSYGVLLWELMTRGAFPYELIPNNAIKKYLYDGGRLEKPLYCPMTVYKVMIACWNLDSELRPTFIEIHEYMNYLYIGLKAKQPAQAEQEPVYVPAKHPVCDMDSRELYLSMAGKPLQWERGG